MSCGSIADYNPICIVRLENHPNEPRFKCSLLSNGEKFHHDTKHELQRKLLITLKPGPGRLYAGHVPRGQ